jgi:hypothetical protein
MSVSVMRRVSETGTVQSKRALEIEGSGGRGLYRTGAATYSVTYYRYHTLLTLDLTTHFLVGS